ncbi:unnamed protein product, partial [Vitis vinifera]
MKASLKFREDQKPLFRAKVPINVLGLPFQSGVVAGESKELTLSLASFFDSGPSLKLAYRPNDSWNPFSLIVKTGSGPFGSPNSSSMMMTAEFNMLGRGNPSFFLHFKPRFGDFCIKKSQSSAFVNHILKSEPNGVVSDEEDGTVEVVEKSEGYFPVNGVFSGNKIGVSPPEGVSAASVINGLFSGVDLSANTVLPMRKGAVLSFRWGLRVPAEGGKGRADKGELRHVGHSGRPTLSFSFQSVQTKTTKPQNLVIFIHTLFYFRIYTGIDFSLIGYPCFIIFCLFLSLSGKKVSLSCPFSFTFPE